MNGSKKLIPLFNAFQFFFSLLWWVPIFYEYQKKMGLNDSEIFKIQSIYYLVFCLLEIPTGLIADLVGYRFCLIAGAFTLVLANLMIPFSGHYDGFLVHFILIALSRSFVSGASSAYLYASFVEKNNLNAYKDAEGKARAYSLIGKIICWSCVGPIMHFHLTLPYWLTALNAAIALLFAFYLPKITEKTIDPNDSSKKFDLKEFFKNLTSSSTLILIMLQGVSIFVLTRILQVNLFQPILGGKGFSYTSYGLVMAGMTFFEALGSFKTNWLKKLINDKNAVTLLTLLIGFSFYLLSFQLQSSIQKPIALFAFFLFSYCVGIAFPIQKKLMIDAIPHPKYRASLLSTESIIDRGVNSIVAVFLGKALSEGRTSGFLIHSAVISIAAAVLIAFGLFYTQKKKGITNVTPHP